MVAFVSVMWVDSVLAADHRVADWRQKLVDASVSDLQKTLYADSILMMAPADSLDLKITLADLSTKVGRYDRAIEVRKSLLNYDDTLLPEDKKLTVKAALAKDLINRDNFIESIGVCNDIIQRSDPESGFEEEMAAYGVLHYISIRTSHNDSHKYLDYGNALLGKARKANYPRRKIEDMERVMTRMRMSELLSKNRFKEFFSLADSVMAQPMSNAYRLQLDLLWAYAKMVNGEDDLAMRKYKEIVDKPLWNVRQGEALLNLSYLLEKYKRYEEAIQLIESKNDIVGLIPRESYIYLAILYNKAVAMNALGDSKDAYPIVQDAFEKLGDLYYKTLMIGAYEAIDDVPYRASGIEGHANGDGRTAIWVLTVLLALATAGCIWFFIRSRQRRQEIVVANRALSELGNRHKDEMSIHIERIKDQEKTVTTNALQLARVNETIELIRELIKNKASSDSDKLKSISTALSTLAPQPELWEIFKINFEQTHSGFFSRLYGKHPDLTPIEARMCAYLAMNLSSKEIASLTNRSLRSVESIRYRLNKKIDLPKNITLATYLRYFTASQSDDSMANETDTPV